jgi:hypothetical protein
VTQPYLGFTFTIVTGDLNPKWKEIKLKAKLAAVKGSNSQIWQQKGPVTIVNVAHKGEQQGTGGGRFSLLNTHMLQNYRLYLPELLGKVQKPSNSECYKPPSEPFRF